MSASNDLAAQVAEELRQEHENSIEDPESFLDEKDDLEFSARRSIFQKIQYQWHNSDKMILEQIERGAQSLFEEEFKDAIAIVDNFYLEMRKPTGQLGPDGRPIFEKDEYGKYVEDWSQITGQDLEKTLLDLQRVKFILAPRVNRLLLEAVYAKYVFNDKHDDTWDKVISGTQGDRTAKANKESRTDKYQAYFRYYLFRSSDVFLKEVDNFMRMLEKLRDWRTWAQE